MSGAVASALSPFAPPPPEPKPSAQQQTIKVEMGEEIIAHRKKAGKKTFVAAFLTLIVGLVLGLGLGVMKEQGSRGKKAIAGAGKLKKEIDTANKKMLDLADALRTGAETMQEGDYPADLADKLKALNVPFSAENFKGKGVAGLPWEIQRTLFKYTSGVAKLNKRKDSLRNLLTGQKKVLETIFARQKKPVVAFAVSFKQQSGSVVAQLLPIKEPFEAAKPKAWPAKFTVRKRVGRKMQDAEAERYLKGKILGTSPNQVIAIPVDRKTTAQFGSKAAVQRLSKSFRDMRELVNGVQSPVPQLQTDGLVKEGKLLLEALGKVAGN